MLISPHLHEKDREVCIKTSSPPVGQVTEHTTVKRTINSMIVEFYGLLDYRQPRRGVCHQKLTEKHLPLKARIPTNRIAVEILIF